MRRSKLRSKALGVLAACGLLLGPLAADAQFYTWTDAQGRTHITDDLSRLQEEEGLDF